MFNAHKKQSPFLGLLGSGGGLPYLTGRASGDKTYVDDVFSTYLPESAVSDQPLNIDNGIDFDTHDGLVWLKRRNGTAGTFTQHALIDTERGADTALLLPSTSGNSVLTGAPYSSSFDSDGFTWGSENNFHPTGADYVSWTFRKAPGFFDIVTYPGNQTARTIPHSLGSVPGMIIIKCITDTSYWRVYHRSTGATKALELNSDDKANPETYWNSTSPTSSVFSLSAETAVNKTDETYVAYIFAHDEASFGTDGNESIIKCGSYPGNDSSTGPEINLGFEPQWLMVKAATGTGPWIIQDMMRSGDQNSNVDFSLNANTSNPEGEFDPNLGVTATGFQPRSTSSYANGSDVTYIYMAIRRPHKPPTAATDVFAIDSYGPTSGRVMTYTSGFPVDMSISKFDFDSTGTLRDIELGSRLTGSNFLVTHSNSPEVSDTSFKYDYQNGWRSNSGTSATSYSYMFKRAPGFFDVVCWDGNSSGNRAIPHALGVTPELLIVKRRGPNGDGWWTQYTGIFGTNTGIRLDSSERLVTGVSAFNGTSAATSSAFYLGSDSSTNGTGVKYLAILFATLPGISKVGSYSGDTNNAVEVDCGFSAGARFVLIKRTDDPGDWYVWDSVRGIGSGDDPYILLNENYSQVTNTDYIDQHPDNKGFKVNSGTSGVPTALNETGGTYLFLAIA